MAPRIEEGTFTTVKGDDFVDYCIKTGIPEDKAKPLKGTNWTIKTRYEDGRYYCAMTCEEMPCLNWFGNMATGVESEVDHVLYGGKAKLIFHQTSDNSFKGEAKTENMGNFTWTEKYTDAGMTVTTTNGSATLTETYERKIKTTGWWKLVKSENMEGYLKAQGVSVDSLPDMSNFKLHLDQIGDTIIMTDHYTKDFKVVTKCKLDEEANFSTPGMPAWDRKFIMTKVGNGKYKFVCRGDKGQKEEWNQVFLPDGSLQWTAHDQVSGQTTKSWLEPTVNISGKFKPVVISGYKEVGAAQGMPDEMVNALSNDFDAVMTIEEREGGVFDWRYDSKVMPLAVMFKFDEEYDMKFMGDNFKCVDTWNKDTIVSVAKCPKYTVKSTVKFTERFVIQTMQIVGMDCASKTIFERV